MRIRGIYNKDSRKRRIKRPCKSHEKAEKV